MSRLIELWTGEDGESHYAERDFEIALQDALRIYTQVSSAGETYEWHTAPHLQYVITLTGTLRFTTRGGESFVIAPGDVLLARDTTGGGHRWELIDDQPWTRIYVELPEQVG